MLRIPQLEWYPAKNWDKGAKLVDPVLLVLHSGDTYPGVAEYEANHGQWINKEGKVVRTSYHVAYSSRSSTFVQQVDLDRQAWHAGGSRWQPMRSRSVNAISLSMAFPGPAKLKVRPAAQLDAALQCAEKMVQLCPTLKYWCRHSDIDRNKRDPGPGVPLDLFDGVLDYAI